MLGRFGKMGAGFARSGGGSGGALPIDPATLFAGSGKGVWFDIYPTYLFQNSDGSGAVTADGDPVAFIADRSGNGNHWYNTGGTDRPIYRTLGGLHWLQCDGINDSFVTLGLTWAPSSDCYLAVQTTDAQWLGYHSQDSAVEFLFVAQDGSAGAQHLGVGSPTILVNGASAGATRDTLHDAVTGATGKVLEAQGAAIPFSRLGFGAYGSYEFSGKFFGGIICPENAPERPRVRTHLGAKMGVAL